MQPAIDLKNKINAHAPTLGIFATDHLWPGLIELSKNVGLDYIVIDREHGPHTDDLVAECCALGRLINFPVLRAVTFDDWPRKRWDWSYCDI